jgi:hypothetical protein
MKWPKLIIPGPNTPEDASIKPQDTSLGILNWLSIILLLLGILIVLLFGASYTGKATILLWMLACLLTGAAIGFLFGIPKILQSNQIPQEDATTKTTKPAYQQQVNTNLTEISDWLTKIIVGLGLVNLTKMPPYLSKVANILAGGLSQPGASPSTIAFAFAYGTIISYSILGFLFGYITTRLYLASAFSKADQNALNLIARISEEAAGAAKSALQKAEFALIKPSAISSELIQTPNEQLEQLAQAYNQIRSNMTSGSARTTKMTKVIKEMMDIVPSLTSFDISQALKESDNGKRLVGYAYLYARPDYQFLGELVDAFTTDPTPFGQYWGIQALGKILELRPNEEIPLNIFKKLKAYYNQLGKGIDREYELSRILPELKK